MGCQSMAHTRSTPRDIYCSERFWEVRGNQRNRWKPTQTWEKHAELYTESNLSSLPGPDYQHYHGKAKVPTFTPNLYEMDA